MRKTYETKGGRKMRKGNNEYLRNEKCNNVQKNKKIMKKGGYIYTAALLGGVMASFYLPMVAYATTAITQPLENLKTLLISVIGVIGVIILAKNVMEFAQAYQQQDSSTMSSALKGIVAGVMMAGISTVLNFLGF